MIGLVLNEGEYVTYPYDVLKPVEDYVKALNWRVTNVNCMGDGSGYSFPFEEQEDSFVDGETLLSMLQEHPKIQWVWGALSGFTKDIPWDEIRKNPIEDLFVRQPYLENTLHHLEPGAVFEMIAFDSTDTYVLIDDPDVADRMLAAFPKAGSLDKYVFKTEK